MTHHPAFYEHMPSHEPPQAVQIEINKEILARLLYKGQLCAGQVRYLNTQSKECVRELCMKACANCMKRQQTS